MRSSPTFATFALGTLTSLLLLSGCASLTPQQCQLGHWQAIGYNDGVAGRSADRISDHQKACAKTGISPDYRAWEQGRQEGLRHYCTPSNAYQLGKRGSSLNHVCPSDIEALQRSNQAGLQQYRLSSQISSTQRDLNKLNSDYDKLRQGEMLGFKTEREAREYLLSLPNRIRDLQSRLQQQQLQLQQLQQRYGQ